VEEGRASARARARAQKRESDHKGRTRARGREGVRPQVGGTGGAQRVGHLEWLHVDRVQHAAMP